jgi:hypothetical protein
MTPSIHISRDDTVLLENAERWCTAMERMGKEAVQSELLRRPAYPGERILDIVYEPPYPTREFCQQWCTEQDNVVLRFSKSTAIILTLVVIIAGCLVQVFTGTSAPSNMPMASAARPAAVSPGGRQSTGVPAPPRYQSGVPAQPPACMGPMCGMTLSPTPSLPQWNPQMQQQTSPQTSSQTSSPISSQTSP